MKKRLISAVLVAGALSFAGGGAAMAAPGDYPATPPGATVSAAVVQAGAPFAFAGHGFVPGERISIVARNLNPSGNVGAGAGNAGRSVVSLAALETQNLSAVADANGDFSVSITLNQPGTYEITGTGAQSGRSVNASVTVVAPVVAQAADIQQPSSTNLASTGLDSSVLLWGGLGLAAVAAGGATVVVARRKHSGAEA